MLHLERRLLNSFFCANKYALRKLSVEKLINKSIIKISGPDRISFLQGLITNDISAINLEKPSLYALFLNNKGRVLYDANIYYENDNLLIECDSTILSDLVKHMTLYRVRKKVNFENSEKIIYAIFDEKATENCALKSPLKVSTPLTACQGEHEDFGTEFLDLLQDKIHPIYADARTVKLGCKLIVNGELDLSPWCVKNDVKISRLGEYEKLRYALGIAEGAKELPPGECLPLEINCDYLRGVNFHKGCYIGQELTARVHHTGVVRKRLLPLTLKSELKALWGSTIETKSGKKVGKLFGTCGQSAIALLRIEDVTNSNFEVVINKVEGEAYIPNWWPAQFDKSSKKLDDERIN